MSSMNGSGPVPGYFKSCQLWWQKVGCVYFSVFFCKYLIYEICLWYKYINFWMIHLFFQRNATGFVIPFLDFDTLMVLVSTWSSPISLLEVDLSGMAPHHEDLIEGFVIQSFERNDGLHPGRLTWNLRIDPLKGKSSSKPSFSGSSC